MRDTHGPETTGDEPVSDEEVVRRIGAWKGLRRRTQTVLGKTRQLVADTAASSQEAVLGAGGCVRDIVGRAEKQVAATMAVVKAAAGRSDGLVDGYLETNRKSFERLAGDVDEALGNSQSIASAGATVAALAGQSRLLALNARIEASRMGAEGRAFRVLAAEMDELSKEVERANDLIGGLTESLLECLPRIQVGFAMFEADTGAFADELKTAGVQASEEIAEVAQNGDCGSGEIVKKATEALAFLTFEDNLMQALHRLEGNIESLANDVANPIAAETDLDQMAADGDVVQEQNTELREAVTAALGDEVADGVMLF